jgi:hypothetical protein
MAQVGFDVFKIEFEFIPSLMCFRYDKMGRKDGTDNLSRIKELFKIFSMQQRGERGFVWCYARIYFKGVL